MPEIKLKHVVSFSSEDKVHKAENLLNPETYRKWKCATPGEKNASIILQFEKATKIHSIDIGNESSAFVEVLVGRSSDSVNNYQVLLVASSFMSPIESRNEQHTNRVRMFGSEKLAQNLKDEKWDCAQVVCTQPFNKNITYGLSFIKFHSPPEKIVEQPVESESKTTTAKLGAFKIKYDDDGEDDHFPSIGSWLERKNKVIDSSLQKTDKDAPSYAAAVLSSNDSPSTSQNPAKRKYDDSDIGKPPAKKESPSVRVNREKVGYRDILGGKNSEESKTNQSKKEKFGPKDIFGLNTSSSNSPTASKKPKDLFGLNTSNSNSLTTSKKPVSRMMEASKAQARDKANLKPRFNELMKGVVFAISGFVNPLRSEIRDKGLEMGAKYKGDWDHTCTHLVCAFINTPKYIQVQGENGKIVTKDWILDCHKKRTLLPWRNFMLGRYARNSSESSESEEEVEVKPKHKPASPVVNGSTKMVSPSPPPVSKKADKTNSKRVLAYENDDSETEDEDAIKDYLADTDVEADSGGDTEDEIRKVEAKTKQNNSKSVPEVVSLDDDDCLESDEESGSLLQTKPDTSKLPLPELPNLFKAKHFYLYGNFSQSKLHDLKRFITAYNGLLEDYMTESVKYVITESKWDSNFEEALAENEDLIFVKPEWIFKCHEQAKMVPYQPYIVIPDS